MYIRVPVTGRQPTTHHLDVREADAVFIAEMAVASGSCAIKLAYKNYQSDVGAVIKLMNPYRCLHICSRLCGMIISAD